MKQIVIKLSLCFFAIILPAASIQAQQFKWVTGGGTSEDFSSSPSSEERTEFMCTDPNGNIYALNQVGNNPIYADTFYRSGGTYGADQNILLTSYNCNGVMRWAKLIASSGGECIPYGITADDLGHIYVAGYLTNETLYVGNDTTIPGAGFQDEGLIQYDTSGHFHWVRYVGDNTCHRWKVPILLAQFLRLMAQTMPIFSIT